MALALRRIVLCEASLVARHHRDNRVDQGGLAGPGLAAKQRDIAEAYITDRQVAPINGRNLLHPHAADSAVTDIKTPPRSSTSIACSEFGVDDALPCVAFRSSMAATA